MMKLLQSLILLAVVTGQSYRPLRLPRLHWTSRAAFCRAVSIPTPQSSGHQSSSSLGTMISGLNGQFKDLLHMAEDKLQRM